MMPFRILMLAAAMFVLVVDPLGAQDPTVAENPWTVTSLVDPSSVIEWSEAVRIGNVSGDPPETSFGNIRDMSVNDRGTEVYVLDGMHNQVRVFDTEGGFLRQ